MNNHFFDTIENARGFVNEKSRDWEILESRVLFTIKDNIIYQEHFSFRDVTNKLHYDISIFQYAGKSEVKISSFKYNKLVTACQNDDLETFNKEILLDHSENAFIISFKHAIFNDNIVMARTFVERKLITDETMKESPLRTATLFDSQNCFFFLFERFTKKSDLIAQILWNNAKGILEKINKSDYWKNKIFVEPYISHNWVYYLLEKKSNETIDFYKTIIKE
jgi:hypothetical protein